MQRFGLANLDWLVVRDLQMIESATFWKNGPEIETGELLTEQIGTEVFFLPAATHVEKAGTFTQTQRLLQWRHKAVEPPADARSDLWFYFHLGPMHPGAAGGLDRPARPAAAGPHLGLPDVGATTSPTPRRCSREINGSRRRQGALVATPSSRTTARPRPAAGSTPASTPTRSTRPPGASPAASRTGRRRVGLGVAGQPADRSTTAPRPTPTASRGASARSTSGGTRSRAVDRRRRAGLRADEAAGLRAAGGGDGAGRDRRHRPVHHAERREGVAVRARPGWPTGRCRRTTSRPSRRWRTCSTSSRPTRPARSIDRA